MDGFCMVYLYPFTGAVFCLSFLPMAVSGESPETQNNYMASPWFLPMCSMAVGVISTLFMLISVCCSV